MSKWVKRVLSVMLVCVLIGGAAPISMIGATAAGEPFNVSMYIADILLSPGSGYDGSAVGGDGLTADSKWLQFYKDPENASAARILAKELQSSGSFMGSVAVWEGLNSVMSPGSIVGDCLTQKGYYEAIIYSIVDDRLNSTPAIAEASVKPAQYGLKLTKALHELFMDLDFNDPIIPGCEHPGG